MAKKVPHKPAPAAARAAAKPVAESDLFTRLEGFLERNANKVFWAIFTLSALLAAGLFEMKIGLANDDSLYIEAGAAYADNFFGYFYSNSAPLYPMILALFIAIFGGSSLVLLKLFSTVCFLLSLYMLFRTFRGRMPYAVLFGSIFITATNHLFLVHAALTYTECFFGLLQVVFLWSCLSLTDKLETSPAFADVWKNWVALGVTVMLMYMTRNVAVVAGLVPVAYFLVTKQFKNAALTILVSVLFIALWEGLKMAVWGDLAGNQFSGQGNAMMMQKASDAKSGEETSFGLVERFFGNVRVYYGGRFWEIIGLVKENTKASTGMTVLAIVLMIPGIVFAFLRKNKAVLLSLFYYALLSAVTFVALHTFWAQARLVMIYLPFIFFVIFYGFYELFKTKALSGYKFFWFVLLLVFALPNFFLAAGKVPKNLTTLSRNIAGDEFYGYTPDWVNFFKASRWSVRNLPEGSFVASRKAPMSFMYGDFKKFFPVYSVISDDPDTLLNHFKKNGVTHVLLAELRLNPNRYIPDRYVNTMHRYMAIIATKYPLVFELVHVEGTNEKTEVYRVRYDMAVPQQPVTEPQILPAPAVQNKPVN